MAVVGRSRQIEEIIKCGKDPIYFLNSYAKIQHPLQGVIPFKTYPFQDDCIRDFVKHRFNIVLKSRQLGLSTLSAAYAVWLTLFHKDQNVLIIATKQRVAAAVIKKVKTVLMNLPPWLKISPITINNKQEVAFKNGSSIKAIPTSEDAGRSEALSLLIIDEAAFIRNFDELWTALYPTLTTGGRAIVLSTPNGVGGQYYELYMGAEQGLNGFNAIKLPWNVHPEHDQAWFDKESKNFSERELAQEMMCVHEECRIVTPDGFKLAKDIKIDDEVLTHKGRFRKVTKIHSRLMNPDEKLFQANVPYNRRGTVLLTGNHPVATSRFIFGDLGNEDKELPVEFLPVETVYSWQNKEVRGGPPSRPRPSLLQVFPRFSFDCLSNQIDTIDLSEIHPNARRVDDHEVRYDNQWENTKRFVKVDFDLGRFVGLYLAEGCGHSTGRKGIRLGFHIEERETHAKFVSDFMESLNVRVRKFPVDGTNGYIVETHNQFMFHLVRFFVEGNYAHEKLLHWNRIKHTNEEFVKGLIVGHFQGDGDHHPENHNSGRKLKLVSVSDRLLYQMRTLLAGTGHLTRIGHCKGKPGHIEHDGVEGKQIDEILKIRPGGLLKKQSRVKLFSNGFFGNVNFSDVTEDYDISSVKVCNFEVDEDHTYVVDSLVVHNCDFLASGETFLSDGDIRWVGSLAKPPAQRMGPDNNVWVWKGPLSHQKYLISADVSRGDATDFSAFHVICYSGEVVAEYKGKIRPDRFAELLIQLGTMYNTALICPESNTYGYAVCMKIQESGYPKLYYQGDRNVYIGDFVPKQDLSKAGFATTGGNRHRILSKLEEVIRNKKLISYSSRFYDELKTFVWLGEKAQAMRNRNDDLLLSMAIGSWILDAAEGYNQDSSLIAEAMLASMGTSRTEFKQPEIRGAGSATYPVPGTNTDPAVDVFQDGKASDRSRFRYGVQVTGPFKWLLD